MGVAVLELESLKAPADGNDTVTELEGAPVGMVQLADRVSVGKGEAAVTSVMPPETDGRADGWLTPEKLTLPASRLRFRIGSSKLSVKLPAAEAVGAT